MNVQTLESTVVALLQRYRSAVFSAVSRQSERLEIASIVAFAEHYRVNGWVVRPVNPKGLRSRFVAKTRTSGQPAAYSHFSAQRGRASVEIRMNLAVRGAHDAGIYCVDVAVLAPGKYPPSTAKTAAWMPLENRYLVTFGEAKYLAVYPMLLAQFIGIVHEIKPRFLRRASSSFGEHGHPPPTLLVLGRYSGNSLSIVQSYLSRGIQVHIAPDFDQRLARYSVSGRTSPLYA